MRVNSRKVVFQTLFVLVTVFPVLAGLLYAFGYSIGVFGIQKEITWEHWHAVIVGGMFWKSIGFSLYIGVLSVSVCVCIALLLSLYWKKQLGKGWLVTTLFIPLCFPSTVMAFFSYQTFSKSGLVSRIWNNIVGATNIEAFPELINDAYGIGIIVTAILLMTPFFIILFSSVYGSERIEQLRKMAYTLGASRQQTIWTVAIPIVLNKTKATLFLFVIFIMGSYELPLLLGRQNPQMISVATVQKLQRFNLYDIPQGYAMSVCYAVFVIALVVLLLYPKKQVVV